jgi:hypothetical protein
MKPSFVKYMLSGVTSALLLAASSPAIADSLEFGDWTTENGTKISVEEDFMSAKYPRHVVILAAEGQGNRDGALIFRCQQNSTEAYFVSGQFDFFGHGTSPVVNVRFPSDDQARATTVSLSSDAEAVFFSNPIEFMTRAVTDGSVGLMGNYYGGSFRHNYVLDEETRSAMYDLATTCEWVDQIPERDDVLVEVERTPAQLLSTELEALIKKYGEDLFSQTTQSLLGALDVTNASTAD